MKRKVKKYKPRTKRQRKHKQERIIQRTTMKDFKNEQTEHIRKGTL